MKLAVLAAIVIIVTALVVPFARDRAEQGDRDSVSSAQWASVPVRYVGAGECRKCHEAEFDAWKGSHHDLAMQPANASTVLGDFDGSTFEHFGVTSTFFRRDGKFFAQSDGRDGALTDFEVKYTFGVSPLQQYLIEFPGGRLQALSVVWDSRSASDGGQRWFHLHPDEKVDHTDQLHWTGRYQNWNLMCAECHSTNVQKGYDAATDSYHTTFSEINVACESCHGPGSRHVEWGRRARPPYAAKPNNGLAVHLASRWSDAWRLDSPNARFPTRDTPPDAAVNNVCAACHARRFTIAESDATTSPGDPLEDTHRLAMPTPPLYHIDGQQLDEVYEWGSFLQSRMHQRGVTCMDCHDPHTSKVRFEGNTLCTRCHTPAIFETEKHHFHTPGTKGATCVACHMPTTAYMVVHDRLDHSMRVPRPDLSASTGAPDACTMCHKDRTPDWAATAMDGWYTPVWRGRKQYGTKLHAGASQGASGLSTLLDLANDGTAPAIIRGAAATLAQPEMLPQALPAAVSLLDDAEPSVRIAGLNLLESFDPPIRLKVAGSLLSDPVRGVRIEAARLIADVPDTQLSPEHRAARQRALDELDASMRLNADWPSENVNYGNLLLKQGRNQEAIAAYERALALDARFVGGYANLADTLRQLGRDADGEAVLRRGLAVVPDAADLHHALGLLLVRKKDTAAALGELREANTLAPESARYAYVYAVALHSSDRSDEALDVLRAAVARNPRDIEILSTLISIHRERGDKDAALGYARKLAEYLPANKQVQQLINDLEREAKQ